MKRITFLLALASIVIVGCTAQDNDRAWALMILLAAYVGIYVVSSAVVKLNDKINRMYVDESGALQEDKPYKPEEYESSFSEPV